MFRNIVFVLSCFLILITSENEESKESKLFANPLDPQTKGEAAKNILAEKEARKIQFQSSLPNLSGVFRLKE